MSSHQRLSRRSMRVWMVVNGVVVIGLAAWLLQPSATAPPPSGRITADDLPSQSAQPPTPSPSPTPDPVPGRDDVLDLPGVRFGISAPDVPWSQTEFDRISDEAGARPTMVQFFVTWEEDYPARTVTASYERRALPVLSWEPWAGQDEGFSQPEYALRRIIDGEFDPYIREFAEALGEHGWPVAIRFAHEMNGTWYPWSEQLSGNQPGEYVAAWQHVHDIFTDLDVTNAVWLWSPNILRPVPEVSLAALYPGDDYVDWIGMVGYAVEETTAGAVFDPTWQALREITDKPLVITETGAEPGPNKPGWISDFFDWLSRRPDVIGFIWFEYRRDQGGNSDWRFTETSETLAAFQDGLAGADLAEPPVRAGAGPLG